MKIKNLLLIGLIVPNIAWAERFTQNGSIVYDNKTELSWQSQPSTNQFNWNSAKNHCTNLSYGGKSDWRLPNIDELKSLVDYNKYNPAMATNFIDIKTDDFYWSSSKYVKDSSSAWIVDFLSGRGNWYERSSIGYAVCVR